MPIDQHNAVTIPRKSLGQESAGNAGANNDDVSLYDTTRTRAREGRGGPRLPHRAAVAQAHRAIVQSCHAENPGC